MTMVVPKNALEQPREANLELGTPKTAPQLHLLEFKCHTQSLVGPRHATHARPIFLRMILRVAMMVEHAAPQTETQQTTLQNLVQSNKPT